MIATIPIWFIVWMALAFAWLLWQTKFLTIRLESTGYQKSQALKSISSGLNSSTNDLVPATDNNDILKTIPYKPSEFIPLEMPEFAGNLNIYCVKE